MSGPRALEVVSPLIRRRGYLADVPARELRRVELIDPASGERVDEALCAVMRAPRSYTGEDVVELSCHGSPAVLRRLVALVVDGGARLAEPGEFTRRAFVNGKIGLVEAEAVALLITARTERAAALAARALGGGLARPIRAIREALVDVIAALEVTLDFPDEGIGADIGAARRRVAALAEDVGRSLAAARQGRVVHDGLTIALVGAPNAGKSSLLNALAGRERAIVSAVAGTTRDTVEATIVVDGVPLTLVDTAGLGTAADAIEAEGMRRTRSAIGDSDLLIVVVDGSAARPAEVLAVSAGHPRLIVRTKSDLRQHADMLDLDEALSVSAVTGAGMDALERRLAHEVAARTRDGGEEGAVVASVRQVEILRKLHGALDAGHGALGTAPLEVALLDLRCALGHASELLGIEVGDAILDRVFSAFCVGK